MRVVTPWRRMGAGLPPLAACAIALQVWRSKGRSANPRLGLALCETLLSGGPRVGSELLERARREPGSTAALVSELVAGLCAVCIEGDSERGDEDDAAGGIGGGDDAAGAEAKRGPAANSALLQKRLKQVR